MWPSTKRKTDEKKQRNDRNHLISRKKLQKYFYKSQCLLSPYVQGTVVLRALCIEHYVLSHIFWQ